MVPRDRTGLHPFNAARPTLFWKQTQITKWRRLFSSKTKNHLGNWRTGGSKERQPPPHFRRTVHPPDDWDDRVRAGHNIKHCELSETVGSFVGTRTACKGVLRLWSRNRPQDAEPACRKYLPFFYLFRFSLVSTFSLAQRSECWCWWTSWKPSYIPWDCIGWSSKTNSTRLMDTCSSRSRSTQLLNSNESI